MADSILNHAYLLGQARRDASLIEADSILADQDRREIEILRHRAKSSLGEVAKALPGLRRDLRAVDAMLGDTVDVEDVARSSDGTCAHCGGTFPMLRSDARYCSARCRVAAKRVRDRGSDAQPITGSL